MVAPVPIATLPLVSGDEQNATVAFITEETIAVARYAPPAKGVFPGSIITVAWRDGNLKASAEEFFSFDTMALGGGLYGVSSGRILSKLTRTPWLLSGKLQKLEDLPSQIVPPEHQGSLVGSLQGFDHWKLYRLGPPLSLVREGPGEILSVSDQVLVSRGDREVRVETIDGNLLGSFQFPPRSKCGGRAEILAPDRLLVTGCGSDRITDFHGKQLRESRH